MKTIHDHLHDMHLSETNGWCLDNLRQPEVHLLQREADTSNRQTAHTDERAENSQAARGAVRRGGVGTRRVTHQGTGEGWGIGADAAGSEKAVKL